MPDFRRFRDAILNMFDGTGSRLLADYAIKSLTMWFWFSAAPYRPWGRAPQPPLIATPSPRRL
jgi:hypothetical protein